MKGDTSELVPQHPFALQELCTPPLSMKQGKKGGVRHDVLGRQAHYHFGREGIYLLTGLRVFREPIFSL